MKMLSLASDGDSIVLGSSISLIKVIHRAGTEYYMAGGAPSGDFGCGASKGDLFGSTTGNWTMLANGNGVLPMTVGNVISENVENEIRMALKAGLESMGVDTKAMLKENVTASPNNSKVLVNQVSVKALGNNSSSNSENNVRSNLQHRNYNNNKCLNNLNLNHHKLDVIAENENNEKMQMTDEEDLNKSSLSSHNKSVSSMMALMATAMAEKEKEDNAQSILEEHCSRIWDSSAGQTPSRSPGRHSPERVLADRSFSTRRAMAGPSPNVSGLLSHKPYHKRAKGDKLDTSGSSASHLASMLSFDSGMGADDKSSSVVRDSAMSAVSSSSRHAAELESRLAGGSSSSKHVHHHHHHHHIKDTKLAGLSSKQIMELEAQSRSMLHYRGSGGSSSADASLRESFSRSYDEGSRGRSRDAKRSNVKKVSDTSSNLDSGVSVRFEPTGNPANEKVLAWMMENEKMHSSTAQYSTDGSERSSSHKRSSHSHKSSSGGSRQGASKKPVQYNASRSGSLDRSIHHPMVSSEYLNLQGHQVLPAQPMVQDPSMPLLNPPNPTDQLEEVRRRLEDECKAKMMRPSRSFNTSLTKDKRSMPPPLYPAMSRSTSGMKTIPPPQALDLSADSENSFSKKVARRPSTSAPTTPAGGEVTVVGYQLPGDDIPYRTTIPGRAVTLGQFKQSITKRGNFRYFFKAPSDEFGSGVIYEEVTDDNSVLPLWEGKVFGKLEKVD